MKKVYFSVACNAYYRGEIEVDSNLTVEEILTTIHNKLDEIPVVDLEWLSDWSPEDAVTEEDIYDIIEEGDCNKIV